MTVIQRPDGRWYVVSGGIDIADFQTHAEAWRCLDRLEGEHVSPIERRSDYGQLGGTSWDGQSVGGEL
jgi:hypothetical protein